MITFIESSIFSKIVNKYLDEEELRLLQNNISANPEEGDLIPGSGGLRKLRWAAKSKGKRGGVRVIYYWKNAAGEIWLLTIYSKNEETNIPANILKKLKEKFEE